LSHLVVHQVVDTPLGGLPRWLDEGLAMYTEGELEPSYQRALEQAIQDERLITVRSLSSSFPADSELAHLSYAQSYDLVRYIIEEQGRSKMAQLLQTFANGAYYDDALQQVLGLDSDGLDAAWREWSVASSPEQRDATPPPVERESLPRRPTVLAATGLCCLGGLAVILIGGLVVIRRRA
jgi:uncharacterized membrane protein YgaE (UPF0421/DUF939 family)